MAYDENNTTAALTPAAYTAMQRAVLRTASAALNAAKAQQALAKATQSAAAAAKNAIAGFDELHVATEKSASSRKGSSSSGRKSSGSTEADEAKTFFEGFLSLLDALCEKLKQLFAPSIAAWGAAFSQIQAALDAAFAKMSAAAQSLWNSALLPLLKFILTEFIPGIVNALSATLAPIFADVASAAINIFANGFVTACRIIEDAVNTLVRPALDLLLTIFTDMCAAVTSTWNTYGKQLLAQVTGIFDGINGIVTSLYEGIIKPVIAAVIALLTELWQNHLSVLWQNLTDMLAAAGVALTALLNNVIVPFIGYLVSTLSPVIKTVLTAAAGVFTFLLGVASDVISGIMTALRGLCEFLTGVFTGDWARAWDGVKTIFSGVWQGIAAILKGAVNGIIGIVNAMTRGIAAGVNGVIGALNAISVTIPKWVPVYGGQSFGISLPSVTAPQIPRLARGAVIPPNAEFLAVLGDQKNGRNLEAPESLLRQIIREETGGEGEMSLTAPVNVTLDGDVLYVAMEKIRARRGAVIGGNFANAI